MSFPSVRGWECAGIMAFFFSLSLYPSLCSDPIPTRAGDTSSSWFSRFFFKWRSSRCLSRALGCCYFFRFLFYAASSNSCIVTEEPGVSGSSHGAPPLARLHPSIHPPHLRTSSSSSQCSSPELLPQQCGDNCPPWFCVNIHWLDLKTKRKKKSWTRLQSDAVIGGWGLGGQPTESVYPDQLNSSQTRRARIRRHGFHAGWRKCNVGVTLEMHALCSESCWWLL